MKKISDKKLLQHWANAVKERAEIEKRVAEYPGDEKIIRGMFK